jgi:hypothetical protein
VSSVAVVELVAWVLSALIAAWLLVDMVRVARTHDEATLVNAPDPLDGPPPAGDATSARSA